MGVKLSSLEPDEITCLAAKVPRLPAICALATLFAISVEAQTDTAEVPKVFADWIAAQKGIGNVKVSFKQTRTTPALKEPVSATGRFWRMTDGRFRWELGTPAGTILIFDRETVHLKESATSDWLALKPDDSRVRMWIRFLSGREMDSGSLTKNFSLKITQQEKQFVTVAMTPRPLLVKKYLKQLDMQIDPASKHLLGFRIVQSDGSTLLMHFEPPEKIQGDPAALFRLP